MKKAMSVVDGEAEGGGDHAIVIGGDWPRKPAGDGLRKLDGGDAEIGRRR